jgi:hypothetical protein
MDTQEAHTTEPKLTPDERAAIRAFLQRSEVRLSTMHRVGGAFLSGAGLLALLPILARDAFAALANAGARAWPVLAGWEYADFWAAAYAIPVIVALGIPLWALWALLQDLTLFYFSANIPSDSATFHPRFALTGITFSRDESALAKKEIREHQFGRHLRFFVIPQNYRRKAWLTDIVRTREGEEVALPSDAIGVPQTGPDVPELRLAFGLAGAYDRELLEEAAKLELSLVRHNIVLRRLVMRYMKALLALIWTALVAFAFAASLSFVNAAQARGVLLAGALAFLTWSLITPWIIRAPVRWTYLEYDQNSPDITRDPHLVNFERWVTWACLLSAALGVAGLVPFIGHYAAYVGLLLLPTIYLLARVHAFGRLRR